MFQWMEVLAQGPVAKAVLALSIVAAVGLVFGSLGVRGIRLGAAGVLFAGIFFGQLGMAYRRTHSPVRQRFWPLVVRILGSGWHAPNSITWVYVFKSNG